MNENSIYWKILSSLWLLIFLCLGITCLVSLMCGVFLLRADYSGTISYLLRQLHAESYRPQFESRYFTIGIFHALPWILCGLALVSGILAYACFYFRLIVEAAIDTVLTRLRMLAKALCIPALRTTAFEKALFVCVVAYILVVRILLSTTLPFHIDEMHSWLYFVDKGPLVSLSYYPSPNNHVLFSLLCCFTDIFIDEPILVMRITSIAIGMLCSLLVFRFILQYTDFSIALLGMLLFSFAPVVQHYSVLARGYMLETFFFVLAFWAFLELLKKPWVLAYQTIFVLASVMAAFTLITYLYAMVGFGIVGTVYFFRRRKLFLWIRMNVVFAVLLLLVYTPLLMFSGISSIAGNTWIIRPEWPEYFAALGNMYQTHAEYFVSIETFSVFLFPLLTFFPVWYLWKTPYRTTVFLSVFLLIISFLICIVQRVVPYERMWTHFLFCQQAMLALCMYEFQKHTPWKYFGLFSKALIIAVAFSYPLTMVYSDRSAPNIYNDAQVVSTVLMQHHPKQIYCQEYVYFNYLSVYARQHQTGTLVENEQSSVRPDFIVLENQAPWPVAFERAHYSLWRNCDPFVCIFRYKR